MYLNMDAYIYFPSPLIAVMQSLQTDLHNNAMKTFLSDFLNHKNIHIELFK